jgi:hypothetical protein
VLLLHILGREELDPRWHGPLRLIDAETGETLEMAVDEAVRRAYRAELRGRIDQLSRVAARRGAGYAFVPSDWPLEQAVIPYLRRQTVLAE